MQLSEILLTSLMISTSCSNNICMTESPKWAIKYIFWEKMRVSRCILKKNGGISIPPVKWGNIGFRNTLTSFIAPWMTIRRMHTERVTETKSKQGNRWLEVFAALTYNLFWDQTAKIVTPLFPISSGDYTVKLEKKFRTIRTSSIPAHLETFLDC